MLYKVCRLYCLTEADRQDLFQEIVIPALAILARLPQRSKIQYLALPDRPEYRDFRPA